MGTRVCIIGAGAWGTAVAKIIADKDIEVRLWSYEKDTVEDINTRHCNTRFLPEVELPPTLHASSDSLWCAEDADFLILAAPSLFILSTLEGLLNAPSIQSGKTVIGVITKGFLPSARGPRLIVESLEDILPKAYKGNLVYISGPSHAEEVARGKITGLIAASENAKNSIRFRELISSAHVLIYSSLDIRGVQVCAAIKNVVAIAFGMLDALKEEGGLGQMFGDGTESLLLAAGLNEIQYLGQAMGATHAETFSSIAGVGDLDVTCRSKLGRNRRFGKDIIQKNILDNFKDIDDLLNRIGELEYLPEGIAACKYGKTIADSLEIKLLITDGLYRILNREISPIDFLHSLVKGMG